MQTAVWKPYTTLDAARQAVQRLLDAGVAREEITILGPALSERASAASLGGGPAYHNRNVERQGSFADVEPEYHDRNVERQGSFGDIDPAMHNRNVERQGSFADVEPEYHDRNVERQGSFADVAAGPGGDATLMNALTSAGIAQSKLDMCLAHLRQGDTLVVVHIGDATAERIARTL